MKYFFNVFNLVIVKNICCALLHHVLIMVLISLKFCLIEVICTWRDSISEGQNHGCTPALGTDKRCSGRF